MLGNTLLIIDDDAHWLNITAAHFESLKYDIHTAGTCADGLRLLDDVKPDYVMTDYHLWDGDAREICEHIRSSDTLKKTLVLVVSGDDGVQYLAYGKCKADHFISKDTPCSTIHEILCGLKRRVHWERGIVENGDIYLKAGDFQVYYDAQPLVRLSRERFLLLSLLVERSPTYVDEQTISARLYASDFPEEKLAAVRVLLHRLKRDLGPLADRIKNSRGVGWAYIPPSE